MANCNECLHGDVCERFTNNVAIVCKRFKHDNDYAEVKHGCWKGKPIAGFCTVRCSVCGMAFSENSGRWLYCPNCGAKMDKKEGAEE